MLILACNSGDELTLPTSRAVYGEWAHNYITREVDNLHIKGGVNTLVINRGETLHKNTYNYGDITTPMPIGSISKIFTGIAIMRLIEENRLNLDTTLDTLLPEVKFDNGEEQIITIKMLLTHTSGIQGVINRDFYTMNYRDGNTYFRTVLDYMNTNPLICEPGKMFLYSNVGYDLLGVIIERISGENFSDFIRKEIFDRANMLDSLVYPGERPAKLPLGYGLTKKPVQPPLIRDIPAGGMLISLRDMESFLYALLDGKIISHKSLQLMTSVQNSDIAVDQNFKMGLSFWLENPLNSRDKIFGHSGDIPPFHANLMILPESRSAIFVGTNDQTKSNSMVIEYSYKLTEVLLQTETDLVVKQKKKAIGERNLINYVEGYYPSALGLLELTSDGKQLQCRIGSMKLYSERLETGFWNLQLKLFGLITIRIPDLELIEYDAYSVDGEDYIAVWMAGIYMGASKRVTPITDMDNFNTNVGTYIITNGQQDEFGIMPDRVEIKRDKSGVYFMHYKMFGAKKTVMLDPHNINFADTSGESRDMGQGLYFTGENSNRYLQWTGLEFQRI